MNTKSVITHVDQTRSVIQAQVDRIAAVKPESPRIVGSGSIGTNAFELLDATVRSDLANAVAAMQAAATAESEAKEAIQKPDNESVSNATVEDGS